MNLHVFLIIMLVAGSAAHLSATEPKAVTDNEELVQLYEADQSDRDPGPEGIDWADVSRRDAERRIRVLELLREGKISTSEDFRHAAMIYQHGESIEDFRLALSMAWIAATIDPSNNSAKWLTAAAWDRLLMNQGQPQWYGTQYTRKDAASKWQLYDVLEGVVTDDQRQKLNVPTLAQSRERLGRMNNH